MAIPGTEAIRSDGSGALAALRRFAQVREPEERCELCGTALGAEHRHLLERAPRRIRCACDACSILFCGQQGARFLRIPQRARRIAGEAIGEVEWEDLPIPIRLAFFYRNEEGTVTAMYPGAGGAVEGLLEAGELSSLFERHAALRTMEPLVEALLVNHVGGQATHLIAPIDDCFRLTGIIRSKWRGLSGGSEVWGAIKEFLDDLEQRAEPAREERHA